MEQINLLDYEENNINFDISSLNSFISDIGIYKEYSEDSNERIEKKNKVNQEQTEKKETKETDKSQLKNDEYNIKIKRPKKSTQIFKIIKKNKKRGRIDNNSKNKINGQHNKFSEDNIIQKIKARFLKNLMIFLNILYSDYIGIENSKLILLIDSSSSRNINRKDNLEWFDKSLKDVFSYKLSSKYRKVSSNENIIKIGKFYEKEKNNKMKLIQILEMKIRDIFNIYINDEKEEMFEKLNNLDYDKKQLEKKMLQNYKDENKMKEYLEKYENIAKNFEQKFKNKGIRIFGKNK